MMFSYEEFINYGIILLVSLMGSLTKEGIKVLFPNKTKGGKIEVVKVLVSGFFIAMLLFFFGDKLKNLVGNKTYLGIVYLMGMFSYQISIAFTNPKKMGSIFRLINGMRKGAMDEMGKALDEIGEDGESDDKT